MVDNNYNHGNITMQKLINLSSVPESLSLVERLVDEVCKECNINEEFYGNILISITEAVNNAIQHGNKNDPSKKVTLACDADIEGGKLCFKVQDEGDGFDYSTVPDPTAPGNMEKLNGRGIFLMRNLADKVGYSMSGRVVELDFNLSSN
jgi:serine/threonine-protein kinase RsbW